MDKFNILGAIFDLDGTLLDSMRLWADIDAQFLGERGIPVTESYTQAVKNMNFSSAAAYTKARYNLPESEEQIKAIWRQMCAKSYACDVSLKEGAAQYLQKLKQNGVKLCIATVLEQKIYRPALTRCGIADLFDCAVEVSEVGKGKEYPDIYIEAARRMGLHPSQCAVYEDILIAVRSAKAAGCIAVGVYDPSSASDRPAIEKTADYYIRSFCDTP